MNLNDCMCIILAAGKGSRLKSDIPKVLHHVHGKPMLDYVIQAVKTVDAGQICIVVGFKRDAIIASCKNESIEFVTQDQQLGTGHAILCTKHTIEKSNCNHVMILAGDCPMIQPNTLNKLYHTHITDHAAATLLTSSLDDASQYGRIIRDNNNQIIGIKEAKDCSASEYAIQEFNSGIYCFKKDDLLSSIDQITAQNKQNEYYLTDTIHLLHAQNKTIEGVHINTPKEILGVNTQDELNDLIMNTNGCINGR